jgi:acyl carrier protein
MNRDELRQRVLAALAEIAPEAGTLEVAGTLPIRDQVDLDSMDFLNFVIALHEQTGVDIAEADYERVATLDGLLDEIQRQQASTG